ncbi:hypothetical protein BC827DRAFT_1155026 [Russula dissimulans]|nr:hypothetical protein BC827DRAFT_1155026 [Russula dissimulans]
MLLFALSLLTPPSFVSYLLMAKSDKKQVPLRYGLPPYGYIFSLFELTSSSRGAVHVDHHPFEVQLIGRVQSVFLRPATVETREKEMNGLNGLNSVFLFIHPTVLALTIDDFACAAAERWSMRQGFPRPSSAALSFGLNI